MSWLCVALRRIFWMTLILIQFLNILHQEMLGDSFLKRTKALYFLFEVIIIVIVSFLLHYCYISIELYMYCIVILLFVPYTVVLTPKVSSMGPSLVSRPGALKIIEPALQPGVQKRHYLMETINPRRQNQQEEL